MKTDSIPIGIQQKHLADESQVLLEAGPAEADRGAEELGAWLVVIVVVVGSRWVLLLMCFVYAIYSLRNLGPGCACHDPQTKNR